MSRFRVQAGQEDWVADAFRDRPHRVDDQPGFVPMEVLRPEESTNEFWLVTVWQDRASFESWHSHHLAVPTKICPRGSMWRPAVAPFNTSSL